MAGSVAVSQSRPIEYCLLGNVTPSGKSMGCYMDRPISESVIDEFGRRYVYAGIAPRRWNGQFDGDALQVGHFILPPGLIYRLDHMTASLLEPLLRMLWAPPLSCRK